LEAPTNLPRRSLIRISSPSFNSRVVSMIRSPTFGNQSLAFASISYWRLPNRFRKPVLGLPTEDCLLLLLLFHPPLSRPFQKINGNASTTKHSYHGILSKSNLSPSSFSAILARSSWTFDPTDFNSQLGLPWENHVCGVLLLNWAPGAIDESEKSVTAQPPSSLWVKIPVSTTSRIASHSLFDHPAKIIIGFWYCPFFGKASE